MLVLIQRCQGIQHHRDHTTQIQTAAEYYDIRRINHEETQKKLRQLQYCRCLCIKDLQLQMLLRLLNINDAKNITLQVKQSKYVYLCKEDKKFAPILTWY